MWVCECQCDKHTIKPVSTKSLNAGTSTNCGCKREETISKKADALIHKKNDKGEIVLKKCSRCQEWKDLSHFWKNKTCKDGYHNECKQCYYTAKENRYNIYKKSAKARDLDFLLSKEEFYILLSGSCKYCGSTTDIGVDRVDSSQGYTLDNCVSCCEKCNKMKLDYSTTDFLEHITKIYQYQKEHNL